MDENVQIVELPKREIAISYGSQGGAFKWDHRESIRPQTMEGS